MVSWPNTGAVPRETRVGVKHTSASTMLSRQVDYIKVNGVPSLLFCDMAEISCGSEALSVWNSKVDNGGEVADTRVEGDAGNELLIKLPYAGADLTVHLLFYPHEPWMAPEMSFSDTLFSASITSKDLEEQVPSLSEWNILADDMLAQLVHQLLQLYRRYQLDRLEEDEILLIQYQSLLKALNIGEGDIEISVSSPEQPSSLLVRLPLSLQDVPLVLVDATSTTPTTLLQVDFPGRQGVFVPKLHLSRGVESLIGSASSLALPAVPPGICLMDYVERIMELLEDKVQKTIHSFEARKQFIAEVLCQFACAVVEYDAERFNNIVLMLEVKDFHFLVFLTLGPTFPQKVPQVVLQSLYHNNAQGPISKELTDLKHSPPWKPETMVKQIMEVILANISSFQMTSTRNSTSRRLV